MQEILLKIWILKKDYAKSFKKLTLFFLSNLISFNEQSYQKQKGCGFNRFSRFNRFSGFGGVDGLGGFCGFDGFIGFGGFSGFDV